MSKCLQLLLDPRYFPAGRVNHADGTVQSGRLRTSRRTCSHAHSSDWGWGSLACGLSTGLLRTWSPASTKKRIQERSGKGGERVRETDRKTERQRVGAGRAEGVGEREAEAQRWKPQHCSGSNLKSDSITSAESTGHTDQPWPSEWGRGSQGCEFQEGEPLGIVEAGCHHLSRSVPKDTIRKHRWEAPTSSSGPESSGCHQLGSTASLEKMVRLWLDSKWERLTLLLTSCKTTGKRIPQALTPPWS